MLCKSLQTDRPLLRTISLVGTTFDPGIVTMTFTMQAPEGYGNQR